VSGLADHLEAEACPHIAVLLRSLDELPGVLASFFALGIRRGGWLAHRALPGQADHERALLTAAGLDVAGLERDGRMVIVEMDFSAPAEGSALPWREQLDAALARGHSGLWYGRFAVQRDNPAYKGMLAVEREWHRTFRDRPVVTLCPFIVDSADPLATLGEVAESHTGVLVPDGAGYRMLRPA
jgi:hypothetical protein